MFFLGGLHGLPHPQRQINGLQRCNSLLCGCQILQGKAVQRLRQLSACMCRAIGSGELWPVEGRDGHAAPEGWARARGRETVFMVPCSFARLETTGLSS